MPWLCPLVLPGLLLLLPGNFVPSCCRSVVASRDWRESVAPVRPDVLLSSISMPLSLTSMSLALLLLLAVRFETAGRDGVG